VPASAEVDGSCRERRQPAAEAGATGREAPAARIR
jgi:hypothetical protein